MPRKTKRKTKRKRKGGAFPRTPQIFNFMRLMWRNIPPDLQVFIATGHKQDSSIINNLNPLHLALFNAFTAAFPQAQPGQTIYHELDFESPNYALEPMDETPIEPQDPIEKIPYESSRNLFRLIIPLKFVVHQNQNQINVIFNHGEVVP